MLAPAVRRWRGSRVRMAACGSEGESRANQSRNGWRPRLVGRPWTRRRATHVSRCSDGGARHDGSSPARWGTRFPAAACVDRRRRMRGLPCRVDAARVRALAAAAQHRVSPPRRGAPGDDSLAGRVAECGAGGRIAPRRRRAGFIPDLLLTVGDRRGRPGRPQRHAFSARAHCTHWNPGPASPSMATRSGSIRHDRVASGRATS